MDEEIVSECNTNQWASERADTLRLEIKNLAKSVKEISDELKKVPRNPDPSRAEFDGEMIAQAILSYRHLEDASMRLGKVMQYANDGESIYGGNVVGSK